MIATIFLMLSEGSPSLIVASDAIATSSILIKRAMACCDVISRICERSSRHKRSRWLILLHDLIMLLIQEERAVV